MRLTGALGAVKKTFNSKGGKKWRSHATSKITQAAKANDRKAALLREQNRQVLLAAARIASGASSPPSASSDSSGTTGQSNESER